jgi:hypothetical protein
MAVFMFILGAIAFLIMVHPLIFFLVALPIFVIALIIFLVWLKK